MALKADAALLRAARTGDALQSWERAAVGDAARLHIPLPDQVSLRATAAALRDLANRLEVLSQQKGGDFQALFTARGAIKQTQLRLKSR